MTGKRLQTDIIFQSWLYAEQKLVILGLLGHIHFVHTHIDTNKPYIYIVLNTPNLNSAYCHVEEIIDLISSWGRKVFRKGL